MGDGINLMLAAAAFNFSKLMKKLASFLFSFFWLTFFSQIQNKDPCTTGHIFGI
jgi:hypothetical protein